MLNTMRWMLVLSIAAGFSFAAIAQEEEAKKKEDEIAEQAQDEEAEDGPRRRSYGEAKLTLNGGDVLVRHSYTIAAGNADYARIPTTEPGEIVDLTLSSPPKLLTDVDIKIGESLVKAHNVHPTYPGVYSLWLKKTDDGWNLLANEKADVWGTMHDAAADVAETPLTYEQVGDDSEVSLALEADSKKRPQPMKVAFEESGAGHLLKITWGAHQWTVPVTAAN